MINFTKLTITDPKKAGKIFSRHDGKLKKETVGYYNIAQAHKQSVKTFQELADVIKLYSANSLIVAGTSALPDVTVKPKAKAGAGEVSRDSDSFPFRKMAGLLVIDTDRASDGEFQRIQTQLHNAIPELASYSMLQTTSTGANVYDSTGEVLSGMTGVHTMFFVQDQTDIPRALEVIHQRLWLAGYGYIVISEPGKALDKSIVDLAMREPSQPLYMRAHLGSGMVQNKLIDIYEGELGDEIIDTRAVIKDLTAKELAQFRSLVEKAKSDHQAACNDQAKIYREKRVHELIANGIEPNAAADAVAAATTRGDLYEDTQICMSDGEIVSVMDILSNPSEYHLATCRDPLEWNYGGPQIAKIYLDQEKPVIRSFAHGGQTFFMHEGKPPTAVNDFEEYIRTGELQKKSELSSLEDIALNDDDESGDIYLAAMETIKLDEAAFYGPLAYIVEKGTENSEATKVGIAAGMIAQWSMFLEPFYIELGDENVGCNINVLSVGQSGHARKGTSSELPNRILAPAIRNKARMLKASQEMAATRLHQMVNEMGHKERALESAKETLELLSSVTANDVEKLKALLEAQEKSIETKKGSLADAKGKLDEAFGTRGYEMRLKEIDKAESELPRLAVELTKLKERLKAYETALESPEAAKKPYQDEQARLTKELAVLARNITALRGRDDTVSDAIANLGRPLKVLSSVSSGEGIIEAIRDPSTHLPEDHPEYDPGVEDKRLFIDVSEFGGILAQTKRPGSMLSSVLRNGYDCKPLETNSRHNPVSVQMPYISIAGSITPKEFNGLLFDKNDVAKNADNGFSNRFIPLFVHRDKLISLPQRTEGTDEMVEVLWSNILNVYKTINPQAEPRSTPFGIDQDTVQLWDVEYKRITTLKAASADAQRLHGRLETSVRKLAVILATMNGEVSVSLPALKAAIAWVNYSAATIDRVVATVTDRMGAEETRRNAAKVLRVLEALGGEATFNDVAQKTNMHKHGLKKKLEIAIASLSNAVPAVIEVIEITKTKADGRALRTKVIRLVGRSV